MVPNVFALAKLMNVSEDESQLFAIARQGLGSACWSLFGGFVKWIMGKEDDGSDSLAVQLVNEKHWEDLFIIIAVSKECLEKVKQYLFLLNHENLTCFCLRERCRGIELQSFWVCVQAIFGHGTQANSEMSFGCSQTMTLGRD
ncbi:hypothetical protein ERO13_D10G141300v2 [Gossypium hirsutum]|uniref:Diphosphomevalonate decarboxylase isoform X1 n=1 Tax=Gossypium hirsutum TaxID=3635 RepID=A0ABM3AU91_GOSHI|nr:diphosphomevalonate decarboxylase-like isoform X1 [Gossypium hirsutum]XP_040958239.1 diphosphomevalonate decarboxylase-like isoform X1 [Gossypium hirsutum]XP_040958240.1 diphosphomevalonate decarboxylase-like isoform X1 [Gossypium hirsutum]XP_040958241.1 diphosphomevalonate decarboxylase-like isoform X1 [Gossypium hirsutum]XP_040958242.1 diphosphomevalonate decarboxylase-like isoform X1 [Gossypium hirsutum]XP_040958243.1 diphosphomevalonate decarboxylase-like isoform X1 [Gossypium hirsutum]